MRTFRLSFSTAANILLSLAVAGSPARGQSLVTPEPVRLDSLNGFRSPAANWQVAGGLAGDPRREKNLTGDPGVGVLISQPQDNAKGNLLTTWEHGDVELDLEFLVPAGSNSGIYLQGRYEVQLYDSWGERDPKFSDAGGIYERWDDTRGAGKEGFEGRAPRANASRAPGLWQRLQVAFEAPRFDDAGKKTRNARFARVTLNGFVVQENIEVTGPTRTSAFADEKPMGPLMIQGDHGPVAIRALAVKHLGAERLAVEGVAYKLYAGDFKLPGEYDAATPTASGTPAQFAYNAVEKSGKFALVFTGTLVAPRDGQYAFSADSNGRVRVQVDGRAVVAPLERGNQPGTLALKAGKHPFRIDVIHTSNARPTFDLMAEGPGMALHAVTARETPPGRGGPPGGRGPNRQFMMDPKDRVLAQRGFVPFEPRKRLYAINVGTPAGVHYAYDTETGGLLRAWRGAFLDTIEMWNARGESQLAKPNGPALTLNDKPNVAMIEFAQSGDWPNQPDALWTAKGYVLEADGLPVFSSALSELTFRDRIAPLPDGRGLTRTLTVGGRLPSWSAWVLLAEAESITPQPGGGWIIGDREWYLDWPADANVTPVLRTVRGRQQLAVPLLGAALENPIVYNLVW